MKRLATKIAMVAGTLALVLGQASPAGAHPGWHLIQGTATADSDTWSISTTTCTGVNSAGLGTCALTGSGDIVEGSACTTSEGSGDGTFSTTPGDVHGFTMVWRTAGRILVLVGTNDDLTTLTGLLRMSLPNEPQCPEVASFSVLGVVAVT